MDQATHNKIVSFIWGTALARTKREIGLLREYRTWLLADMVTHKLDVRAAARHLPAEVLSDDGEFEPEATSAEE